MSIFKIDFFELTFLAERCIPPQPIARTYFWEKLCDTHYHLMSKDERKEMFEFLKPKLNENDEWCAYFLARYNPDNQYQVKVRIGGGKRTFHFPCFLYQESYHITKSKHIDHDVIVEVIKK